MSTPTDIFLSAAMREQSLPALRMLNGMKMSEMLTALAYVEPRFAEKLLSECGTVGKQFNTPRIQFALIVTRQQGVPSEFVIDGLYRNTTHANDLKKSGQVAEAEAFLKSIKAKPLVVDLGRNLVFSYMACDFLLERCKAQGANWDVYRGESGTYEETLARAQATGEEAMKLRNKPSNTGADWKRYHQLVEEMNKLFELAKTRKNELDIKVYDKVHEARRDTWGNMKGTFGIPHLRAWADLVIKNEAGNCNDMAATAFMFLHDMGVRPIDMLALIKGNHAFVVIGRATSGQDATDYRAWGKCAVVCDPWARGFQEGSGEAGSYSVKQFKETMGGLADITEIRSQFRVT